MRTLTPTTSSWKLRATCSARNGCRNTCAPRTTAASNVYWYEEERGGRMKANGFLVALIVVLAASQVEAADAPAGVIEHYGLEQAQTPVSERAGWHKPKRILVGSFIPGVAEALQSAAPGAEVIVANPADIAKQAAKADVVIGFCTPEVLAAGKSIRWIQLVTAGVENCVSIPAVRERDILVTNMQRIGGPIIAEHVMGMVLAFTRGIDIYVAAQPRAEWRRSTPPGRMEVIDG